jgi:hypothetical protein
MWSCTVWSGVSHPDKEQLRPYLDALMPIVRIFPLSLRGLSDVYFSRAIKGVLGVTGVVMAER